MDGLTVGGTDKQVPLSFKNLLGKIHPQAKECGIFNSHVLTVDGPGQNSYIDHSQRMM